MDGSCLYRGKYLLYYTSTVSTYWVMSTWSRCMINATPALECLGSRNPTHRAMGCPAASVRWSSACPGSSGVGLLSVHRIETSHEVHRPGLPTRLGRWVGGGRGSSKIASRTAQSRPRTRKPTGLVSVRPGHRARTGHARQRQRLVGRRTARRMI